MKYIVSYLIGVSCLVAAITRAWYGSGRTQAELRRAALQEIGRH